MSGAGWWPFHHIPRRPHLRLLEKPRRCKEYLALGRLGLEGQSVGPRAEPQARPRLFLPESLENICVSGLPFLIHSHILLCPVYSPKCEEGGGRITCLDLGRTGF